MSPLLRRALFAVIAAILATDAIALFVIDGAPAASPARRETVTATAPSLADAPAGVPGSGAGAAAAFSVSTPSHGAGASRDGAPVQAAAASEATGDPYAVPEFDRGAFAIDLTLTPQCLTRLSNAVATVKAVPGAYVSLVVAYKDGRTGGAMYAGPVAPDGSLVFPFTVPEDAAFGRGHVLVSAHDAAAGTSGRNLVAFEVVEKASSC